MSRAKVQHALAMDYGAAVNPPQAFKWSIPLTAAVRCGNYAGVEMVLAAGAAPSVVSDSGNIGNPLGWTAYVGDLRRATVLVDAGADIDAKETWGTALHEAVRYRSLEAAECLIERSAGINATDQYGNSPRALCRPGTERSDAMCDLLDAHGATSLGHG